MSIEKNFGIGCFNLRPTNDPPFNFSGSQYINSLESTLSKIPNLNNLKIEADPEFKTYESIEEEPLPKLDTDHGFFPTPFELEIRFDLYIPYRIQATIVETDEKFLRTYSENFRVHILHSYYLPVAIVEVLNPSSEPSPSTAVQITREFLKKEINKIDSPISFESLGPSPFHLDGYIRPSSDDLQEDDWAFTSEETIQTGYDKIIIHYNKNLVKDANEAMLHLTDSIKDEFGYFYRYVQIRVGRIIAWSDIQSTLNELLELQQSTGFKAYFNKLFKRSYLIESIFTKIAQFESNSIVYKSLKQTEYNETYKVKEETYFEKFINRELEDDITYPSKQALELITFFEGRRVKNVELIIALIAAILGGVFGSLLTALFESK